MRLLDLFCGAGGASKGYADAGFDIVGVDIAAQPNYPYEFHRADAMAFPLDDFDVIHASPPCQAYLNLGAVNRAQGRVYDHADLIGEIRERLTATQRPYVIENVENTPLRNHIRLCGSSFGLAVRRHRLFESNVALMAYPCAHHLQAESRYWTGWRPNGEHRLATVVQVYGNAGGRDEWSAAMGIDWMTADEMAEAIPPAYTEFIGAQLMQHLTRETVAS